MSESLFDLLRDRETELGDKIAFTLLGEGNQPQQRMSYGELAGRARAIAAELLDRRMNGERALLLYPAGPEFLAAFFGCLAAGVIAVPAPPPESNRQKRSGVRLRSIIEDCAARLVLTASATWEHANAAASDISMSFDCIDTEKVPTDGHPPPEMPRIHGQDVAYLQYTSGSTSTPKGIEVTHANLTHHLASLRRTCAYGPDSVTVTWMPNFHDWGLIEGLLEPLFNRTPCYLMSPFSFVRRPKNWLAAMSEFRGTHSQGPTFAYEHCVRRIPDDALGDLDLRRWRAAGIAAEPINFRVMRQFQEKFAPCGFQWQGFCPAYGLGEATLMVSFCGVDQIPRALSLDAAALERNEVREQPENPQARTVVSCGNVYDDTDVQIVDPGTQDSLPEGRIGEIWIRSAAVARGYWRREADTSETFRACISRGSPGPYLRTGDLGFLQAGELFVTGRLKDLIIIRGSNHYPQDIEWTAQGAHPTLHGQSSVAFSVFLEETERLIVLQEVERAEDERPPPREMLTQIVEAVVEQHEIDVFHLLLLKRGTIPKTASGKLQRSASREAYLRSELSPIAELRASAHAGDRGRESEGGERAPVASPDGLATRSPRSSDKLIAWLRAYAPRRINSLLMDQRRAVAPHVILDFGNQGLFGLQVPRQYGGLELSHEEMIRVLEQLAAIDLSLATLVFLSNTNGLRPILNFATEEVKSRVLPGLATGRQLAAFALSEPAAGANVGAIETTAVRQSSGGWRVTGRKRWNGSAWASWVTVMARESASTTSRQGISAFLIPLNAEGMRIGEESLTTGLRSIVQNSLDLRDVFVPSENLLGESGRGMDVANDALDVGRLCVAAVSLGAMKRCVQLLHRYASRREISTGRLIDHPHGMARLSQMSAQIAVIEAIAHDLATRMDRGDHPPAWLMMVAKVASSEFLNSVTANVLQLLGGRGYMENNEVSRIWRDARSLTIGEGPNESLIGFLGQPSTFAAISAWLTVNSTAEVAHMLQEAREEITASCQMLDSLIVAQRDQWAGFLSGTMAIPAVLHTIIRPSTGGAMEGTRAWARRVLDTTVADVVRSAREGPSPLNRDALHASVRSFAESIGDLRQNLPGEDHGLDELLEPLPPWGASAEVQPAPPPADDSATTKNDLIDSTQRRRILEAALKERWASKKANS